MGDVLCPLRLQHGIYRAQPRYFPLPLPKIYQRFFLSLHLNSPKSDPSTSRCVSTHEHAITEASRIRLSVWELLIHRCRVELE